MSSTTYYDKVNLDLALTLDSLADLASANPAMANCLDLAQYACKTSAPVMIIGETGVGKTLLALAIHYTSARRSRPCVTLNCARLRDHDLKLRLFGEAREDGRPAGLVGKAANGTLVIEGVDLLPAFVQKELLSCLVAPDPAARPAGGARSVAARLVSTSGSEPGRDAPRRLVVEDLIYNLGEITIRVPPLRERREDLAGLVARAVSSANVVHVKRVRGLSRTALDFLRHYDFPGNVRELFLIIDRAVKGTSRDTIYVEDLGLVVDALGDNPHLSSDMTLLSLEEMEKRHISMALLRAGWKKRAAARILRISESMLNRKIRLYGLERGIRPE
jgi:Nif-specific regulatory protein